MISFQNVLSNAGEDFIDEYTSLLVYEEGSEIFNSVKKYLNLNPDSKLDEALEGALDTLKMGIMNTTIVLVTEYAITKTGAILTGIYVYIKGRRFIQSLKDGILNNPVLKRTPLGFVGSTVVGTATNAVIGNQKETLALAGMVNNSANNLVGAIGQERQNQILLQGQKIKRVENAKSKMYGIRNKSREKNMELYMLKFDKGMWKNTQKDKKLYFDCTGQNADTVSFNQEYVNKLNSYANIVTTAGGQIFSHAKLTLDLLTQLGTKVA
jgi:hypothetical protein